MTRPETGPMQFGDDWTGVFLRGDYAGPMAFMLQMLLDRAEKAGIIGAIEAAPLRGLAADIASCDERGERHGLQRMRPFDECVSEEP